MTNCICINGKKIELKAAQIAQLTGGECASTVKLSEIPEGETFKLGEYEFIVLEHNNGTAKVLLKDLLCTSEFSEEDCDFKKSKVKEILKEFGEKLSELIGANNIIPHLVDLTSNDGLKDYGETTERISLLTTDMARKYVQILDKHKLDAWWWLVTPWSTPTHEYSEYVCCVSRRGDIDDSRYDYCCGGGCGVRPFCILNSDIFVS
jgi:hypothetical protein